MINQNTNITQEIKSALGLSELTGYPRKVADAIIPVVPINKKFSNVIETATSAGTIYSIPANRRFFLTAVAVSFGAGAGGGVLTGNVTVSGTNGNGVVKVLLAAVNPITGPGFATCGNNSISLNFPLELKSGTNITLAITAATEARATIYGYLEDLATGA